MRTPTFTNTIARCGETCEDPQHKGQHEAACGRCAAPFAHGDHVKLAKHDPATRRTVDVPARVLAIADPVAACSGGRLWWLTCEVLWDAADLTAGQRVTVAHGQASLL